MTPKERLAFQAMNELDDDLIKDAHDTSKQSSHRILYIRLAIAACLLIVCVCSGALGLNSLPKYSFQVDGSKVSAEKITSYTAQARSVDNTTIPVSVSVKRGTVAITTDTVSKILLESGEEADSIVCTQSQTITWLLPDTGENVCQLTFSDGKQTTILNAWKDASGTIQLIKNK